MVFPFSRSGLKSSGIRYITIGLRRGRVGISVHFAGLFVVVAVGRYKTDVFCFSYFTYIGPEPHNSYSVIFGMLAFGCDDGPENSVVEIDVSEISVFIGFSPISIYDLQKFFPGHVLGIRARDPFRYRFVHCCEMVDPELRQPTVGRAEIHRPGCEKMFAFGAGQITFPNQFAAIHFAVMG